MKHFILTLLVLGCLEGSSQTSLNPHVVEPSSLEQYLWSFSKNKAANQGKPLIDFDAMDNWRQMGSYLAVSDDGKYFAYNTKRPSGTRYWFSRPDSLILQSTVNGWRQAFFKAREGFFTSDSKQYIFQNGAELNIVQLGATNTRQITDVTSYKTNEQRNWLAWMVKGSDSLHLHNFITKKELAFAGITNFDFDKNSEWLICQNSSKDLMIYHLVTSERKHFADVTGYSFSGKGKVLLIKSEKEGRSSLQYVAWPQGTPMTICTTRGKESIASFSVDGSGKRVLFAMIDSANANQAAIWYYEAGMDKALVKLNNDADDRLNGKTINPDVSFTDNGKYVRFQVEATPVVTEKPREDMAGVEVWSYKDVLLQSAQARQVTEVPSYTAIANLESGKIVFMENNNRKLEVLKGDFAVVRNNYKDVEGDRFWEHGWYKDSVWIVSLHNGSTHLLPTSGENSFWLSPDGNWLVYFDPGKRCHYYSYNLHTGNVKDIAVNVPADQFAIKDQGDLTQDERKYANLAAWVENTQSVLVYDTYDIWKLDLTGKKSAENLTNGYGQARNTVLLLFESDHYSGDPAIVKANEPVLLRAFNRETKQNGFYRKGNLNVGAPTSLDMGEYFISLIPGCHDLNLSNEGQAPVKAKHSSLWIVQRQSTDDAPNYFATTDFKAFKRLTNVQPQAQYTWLKQELQTFKHLDGDTGQGILYKPGNFDSTKKYPVVIAFYGQFSNNMYQFRDATYIVQSMSAGMSPAWFLSNGFLVFTPDIAVTPLKYGPKAFSCIEGAAKHLQQLPFVDGDKLAFSAHSSSAQLGTYLFTHSSTFQAASITEGFTFGNVISQALSMKRGESSLAGVEQGRHAGNLWDNKEAWLDQTTVLNVDKAKAALLMLCNKESSEDYLNQAEQLFTALRRTNKSAWWLKYDNGSHALQDLKELKDYNIRHAQFLDHYLRNAPAPRWMTEGIPNKFKAMENRYALDAEHSCGKECLVCMAWNKQYAKSPAMFQKEIKTWVLDKEIAEELTRKQDQRRKELDKEGEVRTREVLRLLAK